MIPSPLFCVSCGTSNPPQALYCVACRQALPRSFNMTGQLSAGSFLKQRYRLLRQVGQGGFGAVYAAEDLQLGGRSVAVKEMSQRGLAPHELHEATNAFEREAHLLARLHHPHLPAIYDYFSEAGRWYLVMELIEGETLEAYVGKKLDKRLAVQEALDIGMQLCTVLDYLHTHQPPIIFRDLKLANIMRTPRGALYLIDFGIARHFKPGQAKDTIAFGSVGYAAPEQYGKAQTTPQSDIYSLGVTLHALLSGRDPADSPFVFAPLQVPHPAGLEPLIRQMLEPEPWKRPPSMAVVKQRLALLAHAGNQPQLTASQARATQQAQQGPNRQSSLMRPVGGWDETSVFAALALYCSPQGVQTAWRIYTYAKSRGATFTWSQGPYASVTAQFLVRGKKIGVLTLEEWPKREGKLCINFEYLVRNGIPRSAISHLVETLRTIPGVKERYLGLEEAQYLKRPSLSIDQILTQSGAVDTIREALETLLRL